MFSIEYTVPSKRKALLFLYLIPLLYFAASSTFSYIPFINGLVFCLTPVIFALIFAKSTLRPYFIVRESWKNMFQIALAILITSNVLAGLSLLVLFILSLTLSLLGFDSDAVSLTPFIVKRTPLEVFIQYNLLLLPFIAIGEELMKVIIFLGIASLLPLPNNYRTPVAVVLAALIFGLFHAIHYSLAYTIPVFVGAIPYFVFFLLFRSIIPLIIAHFIHDGIGFLFHLETVGFPLMLLALITFLTWMFVIKPEERIISYLEERRSQVDVIQLD
ncbi:CPBP family intramembrane metalloprotease [Heliobacterium chlorum]|uniref:CPBP family intramembrane metalloprotease n=1 Tax=Heliobacterium chlorum TaxID=2698 RepID=A0ABR7T828_HELCL|nr:CPBP family intramembrane glutamic endopeptidase [Heliobacterium chlorum]MBC9786277.1 CPBP family intramembrane metalloprotease [Heliobacterium chlorum]